MFSLGTFTSTLSRRSWFWIFSEHVFSLKTFASTLSRDHDFESSLSICSVWACMLLRSHDFESSLSICSAENFHMHVVKKLWFWIFTEILFSQKHLQEVMSLNCFWEYQLHRNITFLSTFSRVMILNLFWKYQLHKNITFTSTWSSQKFQKIMTFLRSSQELILLWMLLINIYFWLSQAHQTDHVIHLKFELFIHHYHAVWIMLTQICCILIWHLIYIRKIYITFTCILKRIMILYCSEIFQFNKKT